MKPKIYSGVDNLPQGTATDEVTPGCIAIEGGAFRGVYGSGVTDALMEAGINMECSVGVSAGSLNAIHYVAGQIGRAGRCNLTYRHDRRYISFLKRRQFGGIFSFDFILNHNPDGVLDWERANRPGRRYYAVATNCLTGEPMYFCHDNCSDMLTAIQASASMPYVSKMVDVDGTPCLDGGCSVKIPYQWALDQGFEKIVVLRSRPEDWRYDDPKEDSKAKIFYRKYPDFARSQATNKARYNRECDEVDVLKASGRVFVIAPSRLIDIKHLEGDMDKLASLYYLGYEDGKGCIPALTQYLSKR